MIFVVSRGCLEGAGGCTQVKGSAQAEENAKLLAVGAALVVPVEVI